MEPIVQKQVFIIAKTTEAIPKNAQIAQLSYIIRETSAVAETIKGSNYFFSVLSMNSMLSKSTGLSVESLRGLSGGLVFADHFAGIAADLRNAEIICHNASFIIPMLKEEFARNVSVFRPLSTYCTMSEFKRVMNLTSGAFVKNPSFSEFVHYRGVTSDEIQVRGKELYRSSELSSHDARYEVSALFLAYFAGPLPRSQKTTPVSSVFDHKGFQFTLSAKKAVSFPLEKLTVTQFLKILYSSVPVPGDQQFILGEVFDELKSGGSLASEGRKTVLSPASASFGFEMEHRSPGPGKSYDVIVANEKGKQFLLDTIFEMHQKRTQSLDALQGKSL